VVPCDRHVWRLTGMRPRARTIVILVLTIGLLAYFFRKADPAAVWAETRQADPVLLILSVVITALTYTIRAFRWQFLLAPIGRTRYWTAFETTVIGFAANSLIPGRVGEVLRPYLLARRESLNATSAFATIILERVLDLVAVLMLFAVFVFGTASNVISGDPAQLALVKFGGAVAAGSAVAGLIVLFALAGHPERLGRAALRVERFLPARLASALAGFVETFAQGLAVMRDPARLVTALVLSFPMWMSIAAGIWLASRAFHITFPYTGSFLVMTVLVVGVAAPTPGGVGAFHAAYQFAVTTFFGASMDRAVGAAIVLHAVSFVPVTLLGLVFMTRQGLTFGSAREIVGAVGPSTRAQESVAQDTRQEARGLPRATPRGAESSGATSPGSASSASSAAGAKSASDAVSNPDAVPIAHRLEKGAR
jgi:glycosyltransferase 2 family protein